MKVIYIVTIYDVGPLAAFDDKEVAEKYIQELHWCQRTVAEIEVIPFVEHET